jgi:hypothetical protein
MSDQTREVPMRAQFFRPAFAAVACGAVITLMPISANAHHGWGGNESEATEMTGTVVEEVSLAGPHATMKLNVNDEIWDITLAPPARTNRAGLQEGIIPVGATVTVNGNRNSDAGRLEMKTFMVKWGDQNFHVYSDR